MKVKDFKKTKVLEEFQIHNDEMLALVRTKKNPEGEFATGIHARYVIARSHVEAFIKFKYNRDDCVNSLGYTGTYTWASVAENRLPLEFMSYTNQFHNRPFNCCILLKEHFIIGPIG